MGFAAAVVHNPVKVAVGVLLVTLFGVIALIEMPMQLTPEVETPKITIETRWPGASPQEVEREIVQEQEEQLKGVEGVLKMSSECMDSQGRITLEFASGTDMSEALLRVNTRLQQVPEYPAEADEPVLKKTSSSDRPIGWFILRPRVPDRKTIEAFAKNHPETGDVLQPALRAHNTGLRVRRLEAAARKLPVIEELLPPDIDVGKLRTFAEDTIEAAFERVDGVSNASVLGGREEELQVVLDPERLASRRLTVASVRAVLVGRNRDTSAGDYWEGKRRYVVRTLGQFKTPDEVRDVVLARRDGVPVYLRDVAHVRMGFKKPDGIVRNFGTTALAINAVRSPGANVLEVMAGLRKARMLLQDGILKQRGLQLEQVYDETDYIYSAVGLVQKNLVIGGVLTIIVLLLFLRSARSTLVIALAIPTSIIGAFLLLSLMGRSLNVISLAGMAFAIGMLVDNAVVVLESIYRKYQAGERRMKAAINGTREVWGAVVASTLTTLAVFLPIVFVQEEAGQLFRDIALAISCSVGLSLIVSVTLIPTLTARILPKRETKAKERGPNLVVRTIVGLNRWLQSKVSRQIGSVVVIVGASILGAWALFPKVEYLPSGNVNLVFGIVLPPAGYNLDELVSLGRKIEADMEPYWNLDPDSDAAAKLGFPAISDFFYVARGRQVFLGVRSHDPLRSGELVDLIRKVTSDLPGVIAIAKQASLFEQGLTSGRTIDVEFTGPQLEKLIGLGLRTMGSVRTVVPNSQAIPQPSLDLSNPEVHIRPRWERMADLGMTAVGLGYTVDSLVDGAYAGDYFVGGRKIDLTLVGQRRFADRLQDLENLAIATPTGDLVPLRALAKVGLSSGPEQINRRERQRAITIQISPPRTIALEQALTDIRDKIVRPMEQDGSLSGDYQVSLAGTADKLRATWDALKFNLLLALLITYLLLAALFESWLYPFVIILSVPLGAVGGFLGLAALNLRVDQPLDVLTMLGFVILIGTVVNNAILIVHQALHFIRDEGMEPKDAIPAGVRTRIRPIFMTMSTTVFGLLPLVLWPGAGSELYRGLGSVLLGGLVVSTLFTLFVVPTFFRFALGLKGALGRGRGEA